MGAPAARLAAVADAGPLIHLGETDGLTLLNVFAELHVPGAVWAETVGSARVDATAMQGLSGLRRVRADPSGVTAFIRDQQLERLQRGECEAFYVARTANVPIILTDDMVARQTAHRLGITPVGSLGIVVRAARGGLIPRENAAAHLVALHEVSSLFVTRAIVDIALEQLRRQC